MQTRFHLGRVQGSSGASRYWGGHAGLMLQAEIGPQRRPPPLTAEVEEEGLQMFHVEPLDRRGVVGTVALVTRPNAGTPLNLPEHRRG